MASGTGHDGPGSVDRLPEDEYLTVAEVAEVAEILKLNQQTIRNWVDRGGLRFVRVGRRVRIKRSDFDQLVEQGYVSRPATSQPSIWDGDVPDAETRSSRAPDLRVCAVRRYTGRLWFTWARVVVRASSTAGAPPSARPRSRP